ncbi:Na+/H+ antiporter NhaC [Phascolarctobacterium sp.]|uniref:Na+/H+ antiporter NhaC n=1 Tax=Phascolarctobacterium sp. TaxID=2049039 RepID=UPI00386E588C
MMIRKPTFAEALVPLLGMVLLLGIGYGKYGLPIQFLLIVAAGLAALIAQRCGYTWKDMITGIAEKITSSLPSLLVMVCVGAMIASWMVSGTIPMMIYYGIKIIDPQFLFVTAFFVTAVISTFTGTSFGSAGTAGVAIMGIAIALGVPLEIAAGAVISGAVFGDKLSPLSDTTMLAPIAAGCDLYDHIKHMLYTTGSATILCIIVYTGIGMSMDVSSMTNPETVNAILSNLESLYNFNLLLLIPPVLIFWGAYTKKPTIPMLLLASVIAIAMGMYFQGFALKTALQAFVGGFKVAMIPGAADVKVVKPIVSLLTRGGLMGMMGTVLLVFCAFAFAGIFSKAGCIEVVLEKIISSIKSVGQLITATVGSTLFMSIVTGSSYLAILIPGEMFKDLYAKFNLEPKNLSRTLEDAGTCAVPLVPWSVAGTYMAATLGVPTLSYLPWTILCYSSFVFAIIFGFTGIGIAKKK